MAKIIQIAVVPKYAESFVDRYGDTQTKTNAKIYALTEDGRIWSRESNDSSSEPWSSEDWPEPKDSDK